MSLSREQTFGFLSKDFDEENKQADVLRYSFLAGSCSPLLRAGGLGALRCPSLVAVEAVVPFLDTTGLCWPKCSSKLLEWRFDLSTVGDSSISLLASSILLLGSSCKGILNCTMCLVSLNSAEPSFLRRRPLAVALADPLQIASAESPWESSLSDVSRVDWWEPLAGGRRTGAATGLTGDAGGVLQGLLGKITKEEHRLRGTMGFLPRWLLSCELLSFSGASSSKMLLLLQYPASLAILLLLLEPPSEPLPGPPSLAAVSPSSTVPFRSPLTFPLGCREICTTLFLEHPPVRALGTNPEEHSCKFA